MSNNRIASLLAFTAAIALAGCAGLATQTREAGLLISGIEQHRYSGDDDLLTAGLGVAGLKSPVPPAFSDPEHPTPAELRRRAIWSNWRGIADLAAGGGYGELYGYLQPVPGREYHALAKLPDARQPHRVMVQLPDSFDAGKRCIVVTASSGSRGIYGAIALAGSWGLAHGCAVAYTDKGAGTGYVDTATGLGAKLDGTRPTISAPKTHATPRRDIRPRAIHDQNTQCADGGAHVDETSGRQRPSSEHRKTAPAIHHEIRPSSASDLRTQSGHGHGIARGRKTGAVERREAAILHGEGTPARERKSRGRGLRESAAKERHAPVRGEGAVHHIDAA